MIRGAISPRPPTIAKKYINVFYKTLNKDKNLKIHLAAPLPPDHISIYTYLTI